MNDKLEQIEKHLNSIDVTLAKQEVHLAEHMRRTEINEKAIEGLARKHWHALIMLLSALGSILTHILIHR
jgi:hypothetical protein